jgi:ParB-like chromosome segregation protein Spo0J
MDTSANPVLPIVEETIVLKKIKPVKFHSEGAGTVAIDDILITDRYRDKYSRNANGTTKYIEEELAPSIAEVGLVQLPVLTKREDGKLELVAGWCRIQAMKLLGHKEIPYILRQACTADQQKQIELVENLRRRDADWKDTAVTIWEIHQLKVKSATKDAKTWGYRETGALVGKSAAQLKDLKAIVEGIKAGDKEICEAPSLDKAKQILASRKQAEFEAELAKRHHAATAKPKKLTTRESGPADKTAPVAMLPTTPGQPKPQPASGQPVHTIELSKMLFNMDCHEWFAQAAPESIDLVYTDIPYGIDMEMLDDITGIDIVKSSHDIDENVSQMKSFLEGCYKVLKKDSYLLFWMDLKHWEKLVAWGTEAGFAVQPFPVIWHKIHGTKNRAAHCQWTKSMEYVMVMRKGKATLREPQTQCIYPCSGKAEREMQKNPFAKPFEFSQWLLKPVIHAGMTILDCYAGGGSLVRAIINLNCRPIAIEKDPKQFPHLMENIKSVYRDVFKNVEFV